MKVCPKCKASIADGSMNYCPKDGTLLEDVPTRRAKAEAKAESDDAEGVTGSTLNRTTIACVAVVFCVVFLMFAEGDVVKFFTIYDFAVPGALILSFTIAMILSLIARYFLKRSLGASAEPSPRSNSFALRLLACASVLILVVGCAVSCNSQDAKVKTINKYDYDLLYGKPGDGKIG